MNTNTTPPLVVCLSGFAESGKDAIADTLCDEYGYERFSFSDAINEMLTVLNPVVRVPLGHAQYSRAYDLRSVPPVATDGDLFVRYADLVGMLGYTEAKTVPEVRRLLQVFGTEVGRKMISESIWADVGARTMHSGLAEGKRFVIVNFRFLNEGDVASSVARAHGGTAEHWYVARPGKGRVNDHESEDLAEAIHEGRRDVDVWVDNDGSLADLRATVVDHLASRLS